MARPGRPLARPARPRPGPLAWLAALALAAATAAGPAAGEVPQDDPGRVETMPPPSPHQVAVGGGMLRRAAIVDLDSGRMLGTVPSGFGPPELLSAPGRGELYMVETHYSRGTRGERTDVLTVYPWDSLAATDEVVLPPRRAIVAVPVAVAGLSDDERFAYVFNLTPATSVTVVDLETRTVADVLSTPGCSLVYPVGPRRFAMLCADGALLVVTLDDAGNEIARERSAPFFDPESDPVTEKGVRIGDRWLFASFEGMLHEIDLSGPEPRFERWPLLSDADRAEQWRIGGTTHLAVHEGLGRLYSLVHQGGPDTHKDPGAEVWIYDLERRERVLRVELPNPGISVYGFPIVAPEDWVWPLRGLATWGIDSVPIGIAEIAVTRGDDPLLVTSAQFSGGLGVHDARTGELLRRAFTGNMVNLGLRTLHPGGVGALAGADAATLRGADVGGAR